MDKEVELKCRCNSPGGDAKCPPGRHCGYFCYELQVKAANDPEYRATLTHTLQQTITVG